MASSTAIIPKISVVVPAFKRPEMMVDIIKSFQVQSLKSKELVIVDDCVEDRSVEQIVKHYQKNDKAIRYVKNTENLGYCKNFLKMLTEASGEYIVVLGDDDIFVKPTALEKYANVFDNNKSVYYAYSNIVQFNERYEMDLAFKNYETDILFADLKNALTNIWLESCYIPGMAFRNSLDFKKLYPNDYLLFPQVELVGKVLGRHDSYGISDFLIGGRAHSGQLGFAALKGKNIKKTEKPSVVELQFITDRVNNYYKEELNIEYVIPKSVANNFFKQAHATILPNEKINVGNQQILVTFWQGFKNNKYLIFDKRFMFYLLISLALPKKILFRLKELRKRQLTNSGFSSDKEEFNSFIKLIDR